jgi:hypothetical protein
MVKAFSVLITKNPLNHTLKLQESHINISVLSSSQWDSIRRDLNANWSIWPALACATSYLLFFTVVRHISDMLINHTIDSYVTEI